MLVFLGMENTEKIDPAVLPSHNHSEPGVARPWVKRLLAGQEFSLPDSVQFWWSVHIEAFLRQARKRAPDVPLEQLVTWKIWRSSAASRRARKTKRSRRFFSFSAVCWDTTSEN
jgi:hypothetical protein